MSGGGGGLLVDVEVERAGEQQGAGGKLGVTLGAGEVNSNTMEGVDSIQPYQSLSDTELAGPSGVGGPGRQRTHSVDSAASIRSYSSTAESAHSGEALLPEVGVRGGPGGRGRRRGGGRENTPLIRSRQRSEYEDLDDDIFNTWPSKSAASHRP